MAVRQYRNLHKSDLWDQLDRLATSSFQMTRQLSDWNPKVDIIEKPNAWEIHAELPGVSKDDIELHIQDRVVTISGARSKKIEEKDGKYHRTERSYGSFKRTFTLPENAEVSSPLLKANLEDGVLEVSIPKKSQEAGEKTKIPITQTSSTSPASSSS
jgi:HSP20 family protein